MRLLKGIVPFLEISNMINSEHPLDNPYPDLEQELDTERELERVLIEARKFNKVDRAILENYLIFGPVWSKISAQVKIKFPNKIGTSITGCKIHFDKMVSKLRINLTHQAWRN